MNNLNTLSLQPKTHLKMIFRKIVFFLICISLFSSAGNAQVSSMDTLPKSATAHTNYVLPLHQLHVGVQVGTQFSTASGYGSALSTYLSPTLTYRLSKRFSLSGGMSIVNTSLFGVKPLYSLAEGNSVPGYSGNFTQTTLWLSGQYLLGNRITLTGTVYKTLDVSGTNSSNYPFYRSNPQGGNLNIDYRVSDHFHIEAGIGYSKGSYGYNYNPYNPVFGNSNNMPFFNR
jgi:hypothetical protein